MYMCISLTIICKYAVYRIELCYVIHFFTIVLNIAYIVSVMIVKCCTLGNPLHEKHDAEGDWRQLVEGKLPRLKKLDGTSSHAILHHNA